MPDQTKRDQQRVSVLVPSLRYLDGLKQPIDIRREVDVAPQAYVPTDAERGADSALVSR